MIENPMVQEKREPKVIDECAGCLGDIYEHEDHFYYAAGKARIHNNHECFYFFVEDISIFVEGKD